MISQPVHEKIITEKNIVVPMNDGVEIATDLYRPDGVPEFPVILSVYPYHKDGMLGAGNQNQVSYFTKRGYGYVMADCRGTGSSAGITTDALDGLNGGDLYKLIEWIADQPWCDGNIGMVGMSYGGMTALKAASMHPPHLKAIVPIMAPAAFYQNLAFPGGALNMLGMCGAWCGLMHCMNLMPPFYHDPEGRWERVWQEHLDNYVPYLIGSLEHLNYDDYWKDREIRVEEIDIPAYIIEGWHDFALKDGIRQYVTAKGPRKILIGPWTHFYLDLVAPEPIDYLYEICRWFDCWLKDMDTGITDEPPVAFYVQGANEWRFARDWPLEREKDAMWQLAKSGRLTAAGRQAADFNHVYSINPAVGTCAGLMTVMPIGIDYPHDQRPDDALSLSFDSVPLRSDMEIAGEPSCRLYVSSTASDVHLVAKLCDVHPDGTSSLVTTGWLRASHRESHEKPAPLLPGQIYEVDISILPIAYCFKAGHRLRLSLSCSDFPRIWPGAEDGEVTFYGGKSHPAYLALPVVSKTRKMKGKPRFQEPDLNYLMETPRIWLPDWRIIEDRANKCLSVESGVYTESPLPSGGDFKLTHSYRASLRGEGLRNPDMAAETTCDAQVGEENFSIRVENEITLNKVDVRACVLRNGRILFEKAFSGKYGV